MNKDASSSLDIPNTSNLENPGVSPINPPKYGYRLVSLVVCLPQPKA
jgi:hypothetical protein